MGLRRIEIKTEPEQAINLQHLADLTPNRLRLIANLLEQDSLYSALCESLTKRYKTPQQLNGYLKERGKRVGQFLTAVDPTKIVEPKKSE